MPNITADELAEFIADWHSRTTGDIDQALAAAILDRINDGTPRANALPAPSGDRLMTPDLTRLDDVTLHKRLVELRDWHARHASWYGRWITVVRRRVVKVSGEEQAARILGTSRATVRKATAAKPE